MATTTLAIGSCWVVSMKSGLGGRNNSAEQRETATAIVEVSMKSGLEGRNNASTTARET